MDLKQYDTVLFDLGGVIINLNYQLTVEAFMQLGIKDLNLSYSQASQTSLFDDYETGKISTQQFINTIKNYVPTSVTPNEIVHAWNAMILDFPADNLAFLEELSQTKKLYLLSNTNAIHLQKVELKLKQVSDKKLSDYFTQAFYSHEIGLRKPYADTFTYVCNQTNIVPTNTLFIDDSEQHLEGAKSIGLNTLFWKQNELLRTRFTL